MVRTIVQTDFNVNNWVTSQRTSFQLFLDAFINSRDELFRN